MASTSSSAGGDDSAKKKSVVIVDMPVEFINRDILKRHFEQFGTVERLACSVSKKYAVIHFSTAEEAEIAAMNGTKIKPDGPPLKIYNQAVSGFGSKFKSSPSAPETSTRLVTKTKIVRTFGTASSSGSNVQIIREPSTSKPESSSSVTASHSKSERESTEHNPSSSTATAQQGPGHWRDSLKISRPSPFLRKKSFGDKSGKAGTSVTKNPFALPPRNKLTLDRRKLSVKKFEKPHSAAKSKPSIANESLGDLSSRAQTQEPKQSACSSSEIILSDDDDENEQPSDAPTEDDRQSRTLADLSDYQQDSNPDPTEAEPSSTLDIDETTEDATLNDDDVVNETVEEPEVIDEENVLAEAETDTQDTAEVSTEEEGEIHDEDVDDEEDADEEQNEENEDEEDDEPYESPLKRAEEKVASSKEEPSTSSSSGGVFSFKLPSTKTNAPAESSSSLFKTPFSSPFSFSSAPKPFSSTSFGIQLSPSSMSKIFAGSSSATAAAETSSSKPEKSTSQPKEKSKVKISSTIQVPKKESKEKQAVSEPEKLKSAPFGLFSSFGASSATIKPSTSSTPSSSSSSTEIKPSVFSGPKVSFSGFTGSGSSSSIAGFSKKTASSSSLASSSVAAPQPTYQPPKHTPNPMLLSFTPDTSEAQELFAKRSNTAEERYRILEARDKIIRSRIPKTKVNVEQAKKLIGTCPDMCPEKERYMRQFQRQLVPYETIPGQDHVVDHQKAIKVYSRSSADQEEPLPHELRPGPTLDFTMHYLLHYIVPMGDNPDENLSDWYHFLWDRTRSIRKDITQQQITDLTAVSLYEKCARFHIHCASRLCELDVHSFDPKLNDENLMKCLQSLEHLYEDLRRRQVTCPSEPEFRSYQIMMNLNEGDALYNAQQLPSWILNSQQVQTALKLHHSIYTKNFVAFFKTVESLPYMTSCILHRYFFQVRSLALRCFIKAHCTLPKYETAMPISTLQRMLGYGSSIQSFSYLCEAHGIRCDIDENKVFLKRKLFYLPQFPSIYRETHLIDSKLYTSVAEAVNGEPLPDIDFANRKPHSSFNEAGQLIAGDIIGSLDFKSGTFVPPEISSFNRTFSKPQSSAPLGGFTFGGVFSQPRKEPVQPPKPLRQIESVCQAATSKLIEESVRQDLEELSQARLEEAKRIREQAAKKKLRQEIASKLATEYVERAIAQHVDTFLRIQSSSRIRQFRAINEVTQRSATVLIDESVSLNINVSARTELMKAKEYHHRLLRTLERIFQRLRARFAVGRWIRFARKKILEREREEEKRREELWNFPVINSFSKTTKDVFLAVCGNSKVHPSIHKVETLSLSPESPLLTPVRSKRKSEGETESPTVGNKVPRMDSGLDYNQQKLLWEFPVCDYTRTNGQVLELLCGKDYVANLRMSPGNAIGEKRKSDNLLPLSNSSPFKIHKLADKPDVERGLGEEIRQKANESSLDLLKNIEDLCAQIKEENQKSKSLEPYLESIEAVNKSCPELNISAESIHDMQDDLDSESQLYGEGNDDWVNDMHSSILSGAFIEESNLLRQIQQFTSQVRQEKAKSWKTDTFLNDIDLSGVF